MAETVLQLKDAAIYQANNLVLGDVNFEMKRGDFVYLIGKTGTGKSSFLKILYGDLNLREGEGEVVGFDLANLKERDIPFLRRKLGVVFQDFLLLNDRTVIGNLEFVLRATGWKDKAEIKEKIDQVLDKVDMKQQGYRFPYELSGGEQQRVAIARALLNDPELIMADEPTGNLDPETSFEVMDVLLDLNKKGHTILVATHDYALLIKYPKKTYKCDANKVYEVAPKQH